MVAKEKTCDLGYGLIQRPVIESVERPRCVRTMKSACQVLHIQNCYTCTGKGIMKILVLLLSAFEGRQQTCLGNSNNEALLTKTQLYNAIRALIFSFPLRTIPDTGWRFADT